MIDTAGWVVNLRSPFGTNARAHRTFARLTHRCSVSAVHPIFLEIYTMSARSLTSGAYLVDRFVTPYSLTPGCPANPGRFTSSERARRVPLVCQIEVTRPPSPETAGVRLPGSPGRFRGTTGRRFLEAAGVISGRPGGRSSIVSRVAGWAAPAARVPSLLRSNEPYRVLQRRLSAPLLASSRFAPAADSRRLH
jgi:hypothetical protein